MKRFLAMLGREMLRDAQRLAEFDEALSVPLIGLDDLPLRPAVENPDGHDAPPRRLMRGVWNGG